MDNFSLEFISSLPRDSKSITVRTQVRTTYIIHYALYIFNYSLYPKKAVYLIDPIFALTVGFWQELTQYTLYAFFVYCINLHCHCWHKTKRGDHIQIASAILIVQPKTF